MTVTQRIVTKASGGHLVACEECLNIGEQRVHKNRNKWDNAHRQGVSVLTSRKLACMCDRTHMDPTDELSRVRDALQRVMDAKGIKRKPLAKKAGLGETVVRDMFERSKDLRLGTLMKLADALDVNVEDFLGSAGVPITGRVGAGGSVIFEELSGDFAPRPPGLGGKLEALEVVGTSMLPRYSSGDVVYISRALDGIGAEDIGEYCAIRLVSGETYIKQLSHGSKPGLFTLRSLNDEDIVDVEIAWATPIIFVLPRAARRQLGL